MREKDLKIYLNDFGRRQTRQQVLQIVEEFMPPTIHQQVSETRRARSDGCNTSPPP